MEQVHPVQIAGLALTIAGAVWVSSLAWKKGGAHDEAFTRIPEIG